MESTVNQVVSKRMVKQQQMRCTKEGAHLLLQVRTVVLNGDLRGNFVGGIRACAIPEITRPPHHRPRFVLVS